jgi:hypothetical protein
MEKKEYFNPEVVRQTLIGVIVPEMSKFAVFGHYIDSKTNRQ